MTLRVYSHVTPTMQREAAQAMDAILGCWPDLRSHRATVGHLRVLCPQGQLDATMGRRSFALLTVGMLLSSCAFAPLTKPTPAGDWTVVTDPFPLVGRPVRIIFRFRDPADRPNAESFPFNVTCATCPEPRPVVTGSATKDRNASELIYSSTVTFPIAGTWWTSPYVDSIEVR